MKYCQLVALIPWIFLKPGYIKGCRITVAKHGSNLSPVFRQFHRPVSEVVAVDDFLAAPGEHYVSSYLVPVGIGYDQTDASLLNLIHTTLLSPL